MSRPNWRTGAPAGNRNALKSGRYTAEQRAFDRDLRLFLRRARLHIAWAKAVWAKEALERKISKTTYPSLPDVPWFLPRKAGEGDRERSEWWRGRTQASAPLPASRLRYSFGGSACRSGEAAEQRRRIGRTPPASGGRTMQAAHDFSKTTSAEFRQKTVLQQLADDFSKTTSAELRQKTVPRQLAEEFSKSTFAEFRQKAVLRQLGEEFSKTTVADFRQKRETGPPSLLPKGRTEIQDLVLSRLRAA